MKDGKIVATPRVVWIPNCYGAVLGCVGVEESGEGF